MIGPAAESASKRRRPFLRFASGVAALTFALTLAAVAPAQPGTPEIRTLFLAENGVSLTDLAAGAQGSGLLLYYRSDRSADAPTLVVRLGRLDAAAARADGDDGVVDVAVAEVFTPPEGREAVPVSFGAERAELEPGLRPALTIEALGGWWVRGDTINYDLDVEIFGDTFAMWGVRLYEDPDLGIAPSRRTASIRIRDPHDEGVPKWDLRRLVPRFPGRGFHRATYAERMCDTPVRIERGVSPAWPFVAAPEANPHNVLQRTPGRIDPPIVVDWDSGRVATFREVVTVRNQNCSYSFYSLPALEEGALNDDVNFETPFAFYDLSGAGLGYPNLIIRTERFPANDPWSTGMDLYDIQEGVLPVPRSTNNVRYSWRNGVGDGRWDYALHLLGFHPYTFETPIAGGFASISAPPYDLFPEWVVGREWPIVNFVATEGTSYRSSEGIYEWNAKYIGLGYAFGWQEEPHRELFDGIRPGFRGEYRYRSVRAPRLYVSPVDQRVHLLGAEGGLWDLGDGGVVELGRLLAGDHLDSWTRVRREEPVGGGRTVVLERLIHLDDYLLHASGDTVRLRRAAVDRAAATFDPPTDPESWSDSVERLEAFDPSARSPADLAGWFDSFAGPVLTLQGVTIGAARTVAGRLHLDVETASGVVAAGDLSLPELAGLAAGPAVIVYDPEGSAWTAKPATAAEVRVAAEVGEVTSLEPAALRLEIANAGGRDAVGAARLRLEDAELGRWDELVVPAGGTRREVVHWVPLGSGGDLVFEFGGDSYPLQTVRVADPRPRTGLDAFPLSVLRDPAVLALLLGGAIAAGLVGLGRIWWRL